MGILDLFAFGKKEKPPFKVPREVSALRTRIDAEDRENYPNLERYKDIRRDAELVYKRLHALIAEGQYAEEAIRIEEDIRKKLERLTQKIKNNMREAKKEGSQDYVDKNIDYLERKSIRNSAKTLFTEFLDAYELFLACCNEEKGGRGEAIDSAAVALINTMAELNISFFTVHDRDMEIQGLKEKTLAKVAGLDDYFRENTARLEENGMKARVAANLQKLSVAAKRLTPH
ncbi:MAG TPA: hypothetical protein VF903_12860 [Nitrospirota bacterium]